MQEPQPIGAQKQALRSRLSQDRARRAPGSADRAAQLPEELTLAGFGVREPGAATRFDRRGARLGYGKGFYDATLREQPVALRIAVGYDFQLLPAIPMDAQDEPGDLVVTPSRRWRTGARPLPVPPVKEELL